MKNEYRMIFEIIVCGEPTDYDPVGCDGLHVKSVRQIADAEHCVQSEHQGQDTDLQAQLGDPCPDCKGKGRLEAAGFKIPCTLCNGTGRVNVTWNWCDTQPAPSVR